MERKTLNVYDICKKEGVEIESEDIKKILEMTIIYENRFNLVYASGIVPKTVVEIESAEYFDEDREWEIVNKLSSKLKTPQVQKALENHGYDLSMGIEMDNWYFNSPGLDSVVINYKELEEAKKFANVDPDFHQEESESEIDIDDVDDSIWEALIKVDKITGIGVDYDKANHSELVMDIRYMIAGRLEEEKKYISCMEPSKKESKKNQIDLDL